MRTFFSAHTSIGQMVIQSWGSEEQKKKYLPETVTGKKAMAFALTEPSAGSDVLNYNGEGGNVVAQMSLRTISEIGTGQVRYSGLERINLAAGAANITVAGSSPIYDVRPNVTGAIVEASDENTVLSTNNTGTLLVEPLLTNTVKVHGTSAADTINVSRLGRARR